MGVANITVIETDVVDDVEFVYPYPTHIFAFRNDKIYTMQEAFDKNYLSHSDIDDIHSISLEQKITVE